MFFFFYNFLWETFFPTFRDRVEFECSTTLRLVHLKIPLLRYIKKWLMLHRLCESLEVVCELCRPFFLQKGGKLAVFLVLSLIFF